LLAYVTILLGMQVVGSLDDSPKLASVDLLFYLTVFVGLPVMLGAMRRRLHAELLREQFLVESMSASLAEPPLVFGTALPAVATGGVGFFMGVSWVWRMWRARAAIERHRQRLREGKARRAGPNPDW
jgi:hypothetical protein